MGNQYDGKKKLFSQKGTNNYVGLLLKYVHL